MASESKKHKCSPWHMWQRGPWELKNKDKGRGGAMFNSALRQQNKRQAKEELEREINQTDLRCAYCCEICSPDSSICKRLNNYKTEQKYNTVPFDVKLATQINAGDIDGRIVSDNGFECRIVGRIRGKYGIVVAYALDPTDAEIVQCVSEDGYAMHKDEFSIHIELPDACGRLDVLPPPQRC